MVHIFFLLYYNNFFKANVTLCAPPEIQENFPSISFQTLEHYRMEYGDNVISIKLVSNIDGKQQN